MQDVIPGLGREQADLERRLKLLQELERLPASPERGSGSASPCKKAVSGVEKLPVRSSYAAKQLRLAADL